MRRIALIAALLFGSFAVATPAQATAFYWRTYQVTTCNPGSTSGTITSTAVTPLGNTWTIALYGYIRPCQIQPITSAFGYLIYTRDFYAHDGPLMHYTATSTTDATVGVRLADWSPVMAICLAATQFNPVTCRSVDMVGGQPRLAPISVTDDRITHSAYTLATLPSLTVGPEPNCGTCLNTPPPN